MLSPYRLRDIFLFLLFFPTMIESTYTVYIYMYIRISLWKIIPLEIRDKKKHTGGNQSEEKCQEQFFLFAK